MSFNLQFNVKLSELLHCRCKQIRWMNGMSSIRRQCIFYRKPKYSILWLLISPGAIAATSVLTFGAIAYTEYSGTRMQIWSNSSTSAPFAFYFRHKCKCKYFVLRALLSTSLARKRVHSFSHNFHVEVQIIMAPFSHFSSTWCTWRILAHVRTFGMVCMCMDLREAMCVLFVSSTSNIVFNPSAIAITEHSQSAKDIDRYFKSRTAICGGPRPPKAGTHFSEPRERAHDKN